MSALKRAVKGVGKWIKKNWKYIVIAAAVVFTAGLATVGTAGFSAAMGTASAAGASGVGAFMSAAGSTMVAGVASIGGTLGIGQGASLAGFGGSGYATLGTGAMAQSLGFAGTNAAMTAGNMARAGAASGSLGSGSAAAQAAANSSGGVLGSSQAAGTAGAVGSGAGAAQTAPAAGGLLGIGGGSGGGGGGGSGGAFENFMKSPYAGAAFQAGSSLIGSYMAARQAEEDWERVKPRGFFGVGLNDTPSLEGPLPGAPRDSHGTVQPMWNPTSFARPSAANFTGNAAIDGGQTEDPMAASPLNPDYDPTAVHVGGRNG